MSTGNKYSGDGGIMQEMGGGNDGLAPSERHLEDWIWTHPEALGTVHNLHEDTYFPAYTLFARQVHVPTGIIDMIGEDWRFTVFELKRGKVTARTFTQLMRYMRDVQGIAEKSVEYYIEHRLPYYEKLKERWMGSEFYVRDLIAGVLIGSGYEDENLLLACAACNVSVFTYEYRDGCYTFDEPYIEQYYNTGAWERVMALAETGFGKLFRDLIEQIVQPEPKREFIEFNAVKAAEKHLRKLYGGAS